MTKPRFSVVMATYGRGRHILPSIRSVLGQGLKDFELLVVGDACADETEAVVRAVADPRVRWLNLDRRVGSQSGPNNAGIAAARAGLIAYLGHDDLWEPDHLERLAELYQSADPPDFAMSGSIMHPPAGVPLTEVHGVFPDGTDIRRYFFPPSAFSHRREVVGRIGGWRLPEEIRPPVDEDLLQRAAEAGLRFRSTGVVTVHKFSAAQRYLSYLRQSSDEQEAVLADFGRAGHAARVAALVAEARAAGRFMVEVRKDFSGYALGELARQSTERRGARRVEVQPLGQGVTLRHRVEPDNLDWRSDLVLGFRLNRLNPRPRLLVPVTGGRARLRFVAACREAQALGPITLDCQGETVVARPGRRWYGLIAWFAGYEAEIQLGSDGPTLLELHLTEAQRPIRKRRRLAVGPLRLFPL